MADSSQDKGLLHHLAILATIAAAVLAVPGAYVAYAQIAHPDTSVRDKIADLSEKIAGTFSHKQPEVPDGSKTVTGATPPRALANLAPLATASSAGLDASLTALEFNDRNIYANIIITNKLARRVYVAAVPYDDSAHLIMASGGQINLTSVAGVPSCSSTLSGCLQNPSSTALSQLAYIDPSSQKTISLKYQFDKEMKSGESGSFSFVMIARFVRETSPDPQPAEQLHFDFTSIPISK